MVDNGYHLRADDDTRSLLFLWRYGWSKECHLDNASEFHCHGYNLRLVGGFWFLTLLWRRHWWYHRRPDYIPDVQQCRRRCLYHSNRQDSRWSDNSFSTLCLVPDEVCHYHTFAYHGLFCRACAFLGLYVLYDFLLCVHILPSCTHDLASRRTVPTMGCCRFRWWYSSSCIFGCGSSCWSHFPWSPQDFYTQQ